MSKMNEVIQIGEIEGKIHYYIEDYAYTFLKKQENMDRKKYFLYGEREETKEKIKLYIYGIGQKPKMEQTYFKEYYPLGFLKIKEEGNYWISLSGQEHLIKGVYVFYAPNQAMQEYLVDYHKEGKKEEKPVENIKKRLPIELLPMKETAIPARKLKVVKRKKTGEEERKWFSMGGILAALLFLVVLTSANGRNKLELFKQVIKETMSQSVGTISEHEFVIEEKKIGQTQSEQTQDSQVQENTDIKEGSKTESEIGNKEKEVEDNNIGINEESNKESEIGAEKKEESEIEMKKENDEKMEVEEKPEERPAEEEYEEYIVQNGDTLVGICKKRYNSLLKIEEICKMNNIKNADYIAPGQKLYLPR